MAKSGKPLLTKKIRTPNEAVHVTAARLRFWVNMKGLVWAAARDGGR